MKRRSLWIIGGLLLAAAPVFIYVGYVGGQAYADEVIERLELVWPGFQQLPDPDRLLLIQLSRQCKMPRVDKTPRMVVNCLRTAATQLDRDAADPQNVPALDRLLDAAPRGSKN